MSRIKFNDRIEPGHEVEVVLSWRHDEPSLEFSLRRRETLCAAGRLAFQPGVQP
jgi:hypothetical protein